MRIGIGVRNRISAQALPRSFLNWRIARMALISVFPRVHADHRAAGTSQEAPVGLGRVRHEGVVCESASPFIRVSTDPVVVDDNHRTRIKWPLVAILVKEIAI